MLPIGESVSNRCRRMLLFRGVRVPGDVVLMSSLSRSMSKSLMIWTCSSNSKQRRRRRRSFRYWRRIWKTANRNKGGGGSVPWCQTRSLLMTILVAHTTLLWRYHMHVARKAYEGEVFNNVKLPLICC